MVSKLKGPEFYDKAANIYYKNIKAPVYFFNDIKEFVPELHSILDIGCGSGYFYYYCNGKKYKDYLGIDFSEEMIQKAREYNPTGNFIVENIYNIGLKTYLKYDMVICLEVLEHVQYDKKVFDDMPSGKQVVFSVPNFDDTAHVRKFANEKVIRDRYSDVVDIDNIKRSYTPKKNIRFICRGFRK